MPIVGPCNKVMAVRYVVIMAGGSGTRLWPLSRHGTPKQLLPLIGGRSLLRLAFERSLESVPAERILVVTGAAHASQVASQLPELPAVNILGEPVGRDSLNAVAWPAAVLLRTDPDAVIAQVTADHIIEPVDEFVATLERAFAVAEADPDALVTLGVVPTSPHTGYGYLHRGDPVSGHPGVHAVREFAEKPLREVAEQYLASGEYWWNAGMFVWRAATVLEQVRLLLPATYEAVTDLAAHPERLDEVFPTLLRTSVDYGIMEPVSHGQGSAHVVAVGLAVSWHDVGGYASLAEVLGRDADGNARSGSVVTLDAPGNIVFNADPDGVVGLVGVSDLVVVRTGTATLVVPIAQAERVKELVQAVTEQVGPQHA